MNNNSHESDDSVFLNSKNTIQDNLYNNASYTSFNAMEEMTEIADKYILSTFDHSVDVVVGGSLGRREMLPNSDIDLFIIIDDLSTQNPNSLKNIDKIESRTIDKFFIGELIKKSLVDGNRIIDGRLINSENKYFSDYVDENNSKDRQLANIISEFRYFRYFDYLDKKTIHGPNLKYSAGSSRDMIFFDWVYRLDTGNMPNSLTAKSELELSLDHIRSEYFLAPPLESIDMILTAKNAAISIYNQSLDHRIKYLSSSTLENIYNHCSEKYREIGFSNAKSFEAQYFISRSEVNWMVEKLIQKIISKYCSDFESVKLDEISKSSKDELIHSKIAFQLWESIIGNNQSLNLDEITPKIMKHDIEFVWGGLMALACSSELHTNTYDKLEEWLNNNEVGAYLLKIISRNSNTSESTHNNAILHYRNKEISE